MTEAVHDSVVIGAGQAGLSTSFHLSRLGVEHLVLDANHAPGGAWQHRWDSLTMADVHRVANLPDAQDPPEAGRANQTVPGYFADYEAEHRLPVRRPVTVDRVVDAEGLLRVHTDHGEFWTRTLVNATGTWTQPHLPHYRGMETFTGLQVHTHDWPGVDAFRGLRTVVVGGGASAVQFLGDLAPLTDTIWVTRREPVWVHGDFDAEMGRHAVARVIDRVAHGLPPESVVSVTGLKLRPQEAEAARLGAYQRRPMFAAIEPDGVRWSDGSFEPVGAIVWATGFRPAIRHLAGLGLRSPAGGVQLDGTTAVADPRIQFVGYGPSASTIGANRAGRSAALGVLARLNSDSSSALPGRSSSITVSPDRT
ncbi:MAG: NAD(P)-binding domain-containing protein [Nocardioides sp.]